ncbi:Mod5 protein sorting/negative effector of RNA Pol III synthesis [Phaffia rhodozyma]|uniref:Mod5 protein sorting/negative effector of RNA Pol III synthesis n=1 Tax=Phaffia rhodozyma TaxID=264483 RepID=A0A0F7SQ74_PHARH|nr:Mod5 protein sorting/negative effector of RNA Pol III synthesis [Phaffia rhodozyma]
MKYLDTPELNHLSERLEYEGAECKVHTRFEVYSCKSVSKERKLFKHLESIHSLEQAEMDEQLSLSPELRDAGLESCFGRLDQKDSRQTWFWIVALLNVAFPDHDFTSVAPDHFVKEHSVNQVLRQLSTTVLELSSQGPRSYGSYPTSMPVLATSPYSLTSTSLQSTSFNAGPGFTHPHLIRVLNQVLNGDLDSCEVYSYSPDMDSDPHAASSDEDESEEDDDEDEEGKDDMTEANDRSYDDDFLEGFEDDQAGGGRAGSTAHGKGHRRESWRRSGGSESDDEGFLPPSLNSLPLVGESKNAFNEPTRKGCLWSVNYFFVSKKQKRILFISCWAKKRDHIPFHLSSYAIQRSSLPSSYHSSSGHKQSFNSGSAGSRRMSGVGLF